MKELNLYPGDNGVHQFWEDTKDEILIFKNHGETVWLAFHNGHVVEDEARTRKLCTEKNDPHCFVSLSASSAPEMAKMLEAKLDIKIRLNRWKRWMPNPDNEKKMKLVRTPGGYDERIVGQKPTPGNCTGEKHERRGHQLGRSG